MRHAEPLPISAAERRARLRRIRRISKRFGFRGRVEYQHVYSAAGGAQYGRGHLPNEDLLVVFAEAFDRDANPQDFSLAAIIAHECGHQVLYRNQMVVRYVTGKTSDDSHEVLASLLGSLIVSDTTDAQALMLKALDDLLDGGMDSDRAVDLLHELRTLLERLL